MTRKTPHQRAIEEAYIRRPLVSTTGATASMNPTLKRYAIRGQVYEVYALNPNPNKAGRTVGYIVAVCDDGRLTPNCVRLDACSPIDGFKLTTCSPSTRVLTQL